MIVASLLFACMGVCVKIGAAQFSTGEQVFYRGAIGVLLMLLIAGGSGVALTTPHWRMHLLRSASGTIALGCYFFAITQLPLATAVTLNYTSPIFVALLLAWWFRERLRRSVVLAMTLGFVGVVLLLRPTLSPALWLGAVAGLGSGLLASLAYVSVRELGRAGEPEVRTVFYFSLLTTLFGLPFVLLGQGPEAVLGEGGWSLLGIGLFGGFAQLAMTRAYRYGATLVAANLAYSTVVFASLFGYWLWDEQLPAAAWVGAALIVSGGVAISFAMRHGD